MANWYGIDGIEFHHGGPINDSTITFEGVTDGAGVTAEETMWSMFQEETNSADYDAFAVYMKENADQVKDLIKMARGELEH